MRSSRRSGIQADLRAVILLLLSALLAVGIRQVIVTFCDPGEIVSEHVPACVTVMLLPAI